MKKSFLPIFLLCLVLSLTACSNDTGNKNPQSLSTATGAYEAKQEILDAAWDSGLIQVDDKLIQLPIHLSDWVALGFDYTVDNGFTAKDFIFTNEDTISFSLRVNDSNICNITISKESNVEGTLEDINPLIEQISVMYQPKDTILYFPGGLTFRDSYMSIEESLGLPTKIYSYDYTYGQIGTAKTDLSYGLQVSVNRDTQLIYGFAIGKGVGASSQADLTAVTFENVPNAQTADVHNVTMLWAPDYKQTSEKAVSRRCFESVLNYEGQKYLMSLSFSMSASSNAESYAEYGNPILDVTDENGMTRMVYRTDESYMIVCRTQMQTLEATICFKNMINPAEDALTVLQDLALEMAGSVQY